MRKTVITVTSFVVYLSVCFAATPLQAQSPTSKSTVTQKTSPSPTIVLPSESPNVGINLSVSPVFLNLTTDPAQPVSSQIRVKNNSSVKEYLQLNLLKFEASNTGDSPKIVDTTPEDEFLKWIDFSEKTFVVEPNQAKSIKVTITPPKSAALGYYYAIVVGRAKEGNVKQTGAAIAGAPAISVLLNVRSPNAKREIQLVDFLTSKLVYETVPVEFQVKVKNSGNIHVVPFGDIFIDWGGKQNIGIVPVNPGRGNVLPQTERTYYATWNDGFMARVPKKENGKTVLDDKGNVVYGTDWDLSKINSLRIGRYTAHLLFVYDNGQRDIPLEAQVSFWVIPWKVILVLLVILFFILVGIKNTFGGFFKRK